MRTLKTILFGFLTSASIIALILICEKLFVVKAGQAGLVIPVMTFLAFVLAQSMNDALNKKY